MWAHKWQMDSTAVAPRTDVQSQRAKGGAKLVLLMNKTLEQMADEVVARVRLSVALRDDDKEDLDSIVDFLNASLRAKHGKKRFRSWKVTNLIERFTHAEVAKFMSDSGVTGATPAERRAQLKQMIVDYKRQVEADRQAEKAARKKR